jgi:hypothetical protein
MSEKDRKFDSEAAPFGATEDMPTVTTLLDRRKRAVSEPVSGGATPIIKSTPRALERRRAQRLELWTVEVLNRGAAPEVAAVRTLLSNGLDWALVLLKSEAEEAFEARAVAGGTRDRWSLWTGLRWSESTAPRVWAAFTAADRLRLNPDDPDHAAWMNAFGCLPGEQAWAFWVGPRQKPLAILLAGGGQRELPTEILDQVAALIR